MGQRRADRRQIHEADREEEIAAMGSQPTGHASTGDGSLVLGLFTCVFRACLGVLGFARFSRRILPLPIIQSVARDTIVCLIGFPTVAYFHIHVPRLQSFLIFKSCVFFDEVLPRQCPTLWFPVVAAGCPLPPREVRTSRAGVVAAIDPDGRHHLLFGLFDRGRHSCH
jgi:hypothetical protein